MRRSKNSQKEELKYKNLTKQEITDIMIKRLSLDVIRRRSVRSSFLIACKSRWKSLGKCKTKPLNHIMGRIRNRNT